MKRWIFILVVILTHLEVVAQEKIDSSQYKIGYKIGENLPVAIILFIAIIIIYKSYKKTSTDDKKTDFMDDGSTKNLK